MNAFPLDTRALSLNPEEKRSLANERFCPRYARAEPESLEQGFSLRFLTVPYGSLRFLTFPYVSLRR